MRSFFGRRARPTSSELLINRFSNNVGGVEHISATRILALPRALFFARVQLALIQPKARSSNPFRSGTAVGTAFALMQSILRESCEGWGSFPSRPLKGQGVLGPYFFCTSSPFVFGYEPVVCMRRMDTQKKGKNKIVLPPPQFEFTADPWRTLLSIAWRPHRLWAFCIPNGLAGRRLIRLPRKTDGAGFEGRKFL
jgi:hypothetical protein